MATVTISKFAINGGHYIQAGAKGPGRVSLWHGDFKDWGLAAPNRPPGS